VVAAARVEGERERAAAGERRALELKRLREPARVDLRRQQEVAVDAAADSTPACKACR
jgi:hypothetical protein